MNLFDKLFGEKQSGDETDSTADYKAELWERGSVATESGGLPYWRWESPYREQLSVPDVEDGCAQNDPEALYWMGILCKRGEIEGEAESEAFGYFEKAADFGFVKALYELAVFYELGREPLEEEDKERAFALYRQAAESGYVEAMNYLALCYHIGMGVEQDESVSTFWYKKAAEQGYPPAIFNLGCRYNNGKGISVDISKAVACFKEATEMGYPPAMYNLAIYYRDGSGGLKQDYAKALRLLNQAAELDNPHALNTLGESHEYRWIGLSPSPKLSFVYYRRAALYGLGRAEYNTARCLESGYGAKKNKASAGRFMQRAAQHGYAPAQERLGDCCYAGGLKIKKDRAAAFEWYTKAAEQGSSHGTYMMGRFYRRGYGIVERNAKKAKEYYQEARRLDFNK